MNRRVCDPYNLGQREVSRQSVGKEGGCMKYGILTLGQIEAIINKLGGVEGVARLLNGDLIIRDPKKSHFRAWRAIILGGPNPIKSLQAYREKLVEAGFAIIGEGEELFKLGWFEFNPTFMGLKIMLASVTPAMLGCTPETSAHEFYKRARICGLEPCSREILLQMFLQYTSVFQCSDAKCFIALDKYGLIVHAQGTQESAEIFTSSCEPDAPIIGGCHERWIFVLRE